MAAWRAGGFIDDRSDETPRRHGGHGRGGISSALGAGGDGHGR